MSWFARIIAHHPCVVLIAVAVFSSTCLVIPLTTIKLPNFKDPQLGFEARGTEIAQRLTAWENLLEATRPSGQLTVNPLQQTRGSSFSKGVVTKTKLLGNGDDKNNSSTGNELTSKINPLANISLVIESDRHNSSNGRSQEDEDDDWETLLSELGSDKDHHHHDHLAPDAFFCNQPNSQYGRVVMVSDGVGDLMSLEGVSRLCRLEKELTSSPEYPKLCELVSRGHCCQPWSLPNYVALLNNKTSCNDITAADVIWTQRLIEICHHYYYDLGDVPEYKRRTVPSQCKLHNAVYNLMHFVLDFEYKGEKTPLQNVMTILPIARSSATLDYYYSLEGRSLKVDNVAVAAIDFGLKSTLFDVSLVQDSRLIGLGAALVTLSMWLYTGSIFVTLMTLLAIAFSLGISYFVYTLIFELRFFPFMNLLASVVAVGVGGDAGLMVCKVWSCVKKQAEECQEGAGARSLARLVTASHRHSALCILVSSLTTAAAFYASYISNITAICCFSVFAGTAVVANLVVMVAWLPATLVVAERLPSWCPRWHPPLPLAALRSALTFSVLRLRYLWLAALGSLAIASAVAVLYFPRLRLPDTPDLQLFRSSHPFEQYDLVYRNRFWFERLQREDNLNNPNAKLPLRFVWGVVPKDSGDYLDPSSRGTLKLDPSFDLAAPESQMWLLAFCSNLRAQPFYQSTMGPLLPNCFLEAFVEWMERRCLDEVEPGRSRVPCCERERFPYSRRVFSVCLARAAASLYATPSSLVLPGGVAGPKFARPPPSGGGIPKLKALVVEYDSNVTRTTSFIEMDRFFRQVEGWSKTELSKAPRGMRNGWFVSELGLYELQGSLQRDTVAAVAASVALATAVVLAATLDLRLAALAVATIAAVIFVTVAALVLVLGWRLNVLEAVTVSVAIGLAADFSIHYSINYKIAPEKDKRESAVAYCVSMTGGPTLVGALTTAAAGGSMLPSQVLAYTQVGVFLVVVSAVSWLYASLFLTSGLAVAGPVTAPRPSSAAAPESHEMRPRPPRSPSAASATTIIHDDDTPLAHAPS